LLATSDADAADVTVSKALAKTWTTNLDSCEKILETFFALKHPNRPMPLVTVFGNRRDSRGKWYPSGTTAHLVWQAIAFLVNGRMKHGKACPSGLEYAIAPEPKPWAP
jgi:hypothetical protein